MANPKKKDEGEEFLKRLMKVSSSPQNILYDFQLSSATKFTQVLLSNKLITIIGECHNKRFSCKGRTITISEYCAKRVKANSKCRIILEVNQSLESKLNEMGSDIFYNIYEAVPRENILFYDYRSYFLGYEGQNCLYNTIDCDKIQENTKSFLELNIEHIIKKYFTSFVDKFHEQFKINKINHNDVEFKLMTLYFEFVTNAYEKLKKFFDENINNIETNIQYKQQLHNHLRHFWMIICDFFILRKCLDKEDINEYIIVIGESHLDNMYNFFKMNQNLYDSFVKIIVKEKQDGSENNCINVKNPDFIVFS